MTIAIGWIITFMVLSALLGVVAGALGASSSKGDLSAQAAAEKRKVRNLEQEMAFRDTSLSTWKRATEEVRKQRDEVEKTLVRTADALDWLVAETPGLDGALEFPPDTADTIERVEALREDLERQNATSAWCDFVAGGYL